MTLGTRLFTWWHGRAVGTDALGNTYYEDKRAKPGTPPRRWVVFGATADASAVAPEWHMWLHSHDAPPPGDVPIRPWQLPHMPNMTGTLLAYRPPGHDYEGGRARTAQADYEAWTPEG